ncbi:MAG: hypothetical protein ACLQVD_02605 [Capsulimonadaceae bacterium]
MITLRSFLDFCASLRRLGLVGWGIAGAVSGMIALSLLVICYDAHTCGGVDNRLLDTIWELAFVASPVLLLLATVALRIRHLRLDEVSRRRRVLVYLAGAVLVIVIIVMEATMLPDQYSGPSDASMVSRFQQRRAAFDRLARMTQYDKNLSTIDDDSVYPVSGTTDAGVSPGRIEIYRSLLHQIGGDESVDIADGYVEIDYWNAEVGFPGSDAMVTKNYSWCAKPPDGLVTRPLDTLKLDSLEENKAYYRHIDGNWYIYYLWVYNGM